MRHKIYKKIVLVVLDGFGIASAGHGNAIGIANPATINYLVSQYPSLSLQASGPLVGLPWGEMGNSEVGHLNIGGGRIVGQDLPRITQAISDGTFFKNQIFTQACDHAKKNNSALHIMGMASNGNVHSSDEHLYALIAFAKECGLKDVYIHMFTDGRDTAEKAALDTLRKLKQKIAAIGVGKVASVTGRFYAMDRGKHWEQTLMTYEALVFGKGPKYSSAEDCILDNYNNGVYDEMIQPSVITKDDGSDPVAVVKDGDAVVFFNFRSDRALQLTEAFVKPELVEVKDRYEPLKNLFFVTMTEYLYGLPVHVAFAPVDLRNNLAEVISSSGLKQFHIAESEKFAHVTSFFNGGRSDPFPLEERVIVRSPLDNSMNYVDKPEMSAMDITEILIEKITKSDHQFLVANFANSDMVGHTGNLNATVLAIGAIDKCLTKIMDASLMVDALLIITADHGNSEEMIDLRTGEVDKDHTTNPVPCLVIANEFRFQNSKDKNYLSLSSRVPDGVISDIAPTVLEFFGLPKAPEMTGVSLVDLILKQVEVGK
jgi:2,3-bisphosphoglycerate-independent phosphoglycerate mutase